MNKQSWAFLALGLLSMGGARAEDPVERDECGLALDLVADDGQPNGTEVFFKPIRRVDGFSQFYLVGSDEGTRAYLENIKANKNRPFNVCATSIDAVQANPENPPVALWKITAIKDQE